MDISIKFWRDCPSNSSRCCSTFSMPNQSVAHILPCKKGVTKANKEFRQLSRLSQCSRALWRLVEQHGWPIYARSHLFFHSITNPQRLLRATSWADKVRIASSIDRSWQFFENIKVREFLGFPGRTMPVIKLQEDSRRLIVAGGSSLSTFTFLGTRATPVEETHLRPMGFRDHDGRVSNAWIGRSAIDDVTAIAPVEGTGDFIISHVSGLLQKCRIQCNSRGRPQIRSVCNYSHPRKIIQALDAGVSGILVCATSHTGGSISIYQTRSPWLEPYVWRLKTRPWSLLLQPAETRPTWLAIGQSGVHPLSIYTLGEDGLPVDSDNPEFFLGNDCSTAVYNFASPPPTSPIGTARHVIVSGWYDGSVRVHDLRRHSKEPVIELVDPFADVPVYSVACGGGSGYTIAAGTARHGLIRVWDVRKAALENAGHSVFGPGKDSSPVYGLQMEHDRLFGVTDRRAYMLEFGGASLQSTNNQGYTRRDEYHRYNSRERNRQGLLSRRDDAEDAGLYYYKHSEMKLQRAD